MKNKRDSFSCTLAAHKAEMDVHINSRSAVLKTMIKYVDSAGLESHHQWWLL